MAEKYFFEEKNAKKAASKARTTARVAARTRAAKKAAVGSDTKPFNVRLMTPRELVGGTEPRSTKNPIIKVTKKLSQAPKRTVGKKELQPIAKKSTAVKRTVGKKAGKK